MSESYVRNVLEAALLAELRDCAGEGCRVTADPLGPSDGL